MLEHVSTCACALSERALRAWAHVCTCVQSGSLFTEETSWRLEEVLCSEAERNSARLRRAAKPIAKNTYYTATFCK